MTKALLTSPGCGGCHHVKKELKPLLDDGTIREISVTTEEGKAIAKELGVRQVPECLDMGEDGKYTVCDLEDLLDEADERREKDKEKAPE
jgi:hypothetical protein